MTRESATPADPGVLYDSPIQAEEVYWRAATDDGRDTAFGRKYAAEQCDRGAVAR